MKNQKGAITLITLVTVLFMISFLVSSYIVIMNRAQAQAEIKRETANLYQNEAKNSDEIYNSFFADSSETIPVKTAEQLLQVGTGNDVAIDGKIYKFTSDANYRLENAISLNVEDYQTEYQNVFEEKTWVTLQKETLTNQVTNYATANTTSEPYSTYTAPGTGTYTLQVWGAQGGQGGPSNLGGKGGYSIGTINLTQGDNLYVYVGGQGSGSTSASSSTLERAGGYNGGGTSYQTTNGTRGSGGGATDMRFVAGTWNDSTSLKSRVIVAGGGGGNLYFNGNSYTSGVGGGTSGTAGVAASSGDTAGQGGTQTSAGSGDTDYTAAGFGYGGSKPSSSTYKICGRRRRLVRRRSR